MLRFDHIRWISVWFLPEGGKFPYDIGRAEFSAHGASTDGPGTVFAASCCNERS